MHIKANELCSDLQSGHVPDKPHLMKSLKEIAQAQRRQQNNRRAGPFHQGREAG